MSALPLPLMPATIEDRLMRLNRLVAASIARQEATCADVIATCDRAEQGLDALLAQINTPLRPLP